MPKIRFAKNNRPEIDAETGANLMRALLAQGVPVASSCHGDGVCAKCRLRIAAGAENLSSRNETEAFLIERYQLSSDVRISCQAQIFGDVTVDATYW